MEKISTNLISGPDCCQIMHQRPALGALSPNLPDVSVDATTTTSPGGPGAAQLKLPTLIGEGL